MVLQKFKMCQDEGTSSNTGAQTGHAEDYQKILTGNLNMNPFY